MNHELFMYTVVLSMAAPLQNPGLDWIRLDLFKIKNDDFIGMGSAMYSNLVF